MWIEEEVEAEDELPVHHEDTGVTDFSNVSFAPCLNTTVSCFFIDMGVPVARLIEEESRRSFAYLKQIEIVARSKQISLEYAPVSLSMGQLAAVLHKNIIRDLASTRDIIGYLCFEESGESNFCCVPEPIEKIADLDELSTQFNQAIDVSTTIRDRYGRNAMLTPTYDAIRMWYPEGCVQCIFNLSALLVKTSLSCTIVNSRESYAFRQRETFMSDLVCDIACGYAFNNKDSHHKHRLLHLMQEAMLSETRFSSTCVGYGRDIDAKLRLRIYKKRTAIVQEHSNDDDSLHTAISRHMGYDTTQVMPWVAVMIYIANQMFGTIGSDCIRSFVKPQKRITGHCLLTERDTNRIIYFS
ncbi:MAG: hypothetical protein ACOVQN_00510 [Exiguobacterium sp.]